MAELSVHQYGVAVPMSYDHISSGVRLLQGIFPETFSNIKFENLNCQPTNNPFMYNYYNVKVKRSIAWFAWHYFPADEDDQNTLLLAIQSFE